jgi:putative membrane protein
MLLRQHLSVYRVLKITWRIDLVILSLCTAAYFFDTQIMVTVHILPALPTLMGAATAFFIGFNNNQAYSRWWEARTIWGGLVNDSRSWTRGLTAYCGGHQGAPMEDIAPGTITGERRAYARKMILRHIGFLYALKAALRKEPDDSFEKYLPTEDIATVRRFSNIPNAILDLQAQDLEKLSRLQATDGFRFLALNEVLKGFCDNMGRSERINNTVFPTTYIYFTRLFIWILVILVTMTLSESIGPWSIFFGWVIGFAFHASQINGMSLMNPFEPIPSGVPLNSITRTIEINLLQALGETDIPAPEPTQREGEYVL